LTQKTLSFVCCCAKADPVKATAAATATADIQVLSCMRGVSMKEVSVEAGLAQAKPRPIKSYDERKAIGYGQTRITRAQAFSARTHIPAPA
jgi:hypothetical protein